MPVISTCFTRFKGSYNTIYYSINCQTRHTTARCVQQKLSNGGVQLNRNHPDAWPVISLLFGTWKRDNRMSYHMPSESLFSQKKNIANNQAGSNYT